MLAFGPPYDFWTGREIEDVKKSSLNANDFPEVAARPQAATARARAVTLDLISEDEIRSTVRRALWRTEPEEVVRIIAQVRAALMASDIRGAELASKACRIKPWRELM